MAPLIKPECRLAIDFTAENFQLGDVVIFTAEKKFFAHRIVGRKIQNGNFFFLLKGDNNPHYDGWFSLLKIYGRVEKVVYPDRTINLLTFKNQILKYFFTSYSRLSFHFPFLLKLRAVYKVLFLRFIFRLIIR